MIKTINEWLPWVAMIVMYVAGKLADYYEYSKKNDPEMATKLKHVGELAKWAVADQSRYNKPGVNKFDDAVKSVENQVKGQDIDQSTIKGAVQDAYNNSNLSKPVVQESIEVPKATDNYLEPVHDDSAILDDLEAK
ncbi:hypothetical protein [Lactobacillus hominis]|uniref:hypothetical protein n=1 Tax=Lactobacillus hominis TaxID=1203033 RepID=UPI0023F5479F|nr:hypothetical protein [Lactobacillus hominis]